MIALALLGAATAGTHLDRVELISVDPGVWLNYDLPTLVTRPTSTTVRLVQQVQPVLALPPEGLHLGLSLTSQSVSWEQPFAESRWGWAAGVTTLFALPRGAFAEATVDLGPVRLGLGGSLMSQASWARLSGYDTWDPLLGATVGLLTRKGRAR